LDGASGSAAEGKAEAAVGVKTGRFQPSDRLLDSRDFTRVLRRGRRRSSSELVVVTTEVRRDGRSSPQSGWGESPGSRLGITVGRKAGPSVKRNRFKRRVREWFRHHRDELQGPFDIVVIARRPGIDLSLAQLAVRLSALLGSKRSQTTEKIQDSTQL
jgi:ribonuclease P protein component